MGDAFRGLTLRIGADARPLQQSLASIKSAASGAEQQLRSMNKALNFDAGNVDAMKSRIVLMSDKTKLAARSVADIGIAMSQAAAKTVTFSEKSGLASGKIKDVAKSTREIYSATQLVQSEYNRVNAELETIYNAVRKVVAKEKGWKQDSEELDKYMSKLKESYGKAGDEQQQLTKEMQAYLSTAMRTGDIAEKFGLQRHETGKLLVELKDLRAEHKRLQGDLSNIHAIEGYRAIETQLIAVKSEMMAAAAEATRFRTELYRMGSSEALHDALTDVRALDGAIDAARASTRSMEDAFRAMPASIEAAKAKLRATREETVLLSAKLEKAREVVKQIESNSAFDKQARSIKNVHAALAQAEADAAKYEAQIKEAEERVKALNDQIESGNPAAWKEAGTSLEKLQSELTETKAKLESLKQEFIEVDARHRSATMAVAYREAREEVIRLEAELAKLNSETARLNTLKERFSSIRTLGYGLYSTVTPALMMVGRYAINAAEDIDAAYRDMRKTVNGTESDFESLKAAAIDFSRTHVTTAEQMLEIESIGGQLGIAVENLQTFGEVVSNLDIATNIDAEDIATYLGQLSNIMDDINTDDVDQYQKDITAFSDALVRLGNNSAAQESNIMKVQMRIASLGNISGFTTPQLLGISTAIAATGQGSEAAGTAIARTFSNIESAVGKGGDKLQAFADVAGMSAQDFADAWNGDPMTAFTAFIGGLKEIDEAGGSVDNTLASLGINSVRQKQALEGLTNTFDIMTASVNMSEDAWAGMSSVMADGKVEKAGDAAREAGRKSEGFSGAIQMLRNNATALGNSLAEGAAPIISMLAGLFQGLTSAVEAMPGPLKTAIVAIAGIVAVAGPAAIAIGAVGAAYATLGELKQKKISSKTQLLADAAAALADAEANLADARANERNAQAKLSNAIQGKSGQSVQAALTAYTEAHTASVAAETAVEEANGKVEAANGGIKATLTGITNSLTAATTRLATALGISNAMLLGFASAGIAIVAAAAGIRAILDPANQLTEESKNLASEAGAARLKYEELSAELGENAEETIKAKAAAEELEQQWKENRQTVGELASEMREEIAASREMREGISESKEEADRSAGSILNTVDAINELRQADDEASTAKLAAYIATLNSTVEGYSLSASDAKENTANFQKAMAEAEDKARQLRLDTAVEGYASLSNEASILSGKMQEIIDKTGLTEEAIQIYKAAQDAAAQGYYTDDGTGGAAAAYVELEKELEAVNAQMEEQQKLVQENLDKNEAASLAIRMKTQHNLDEAEALAYANEMLGTNITNTDLEAYATQQANDALAEAEEQLSSYTDSIAEACESNETLADVIDSTGMSYEALAQWLIDAGISVDDFAQGVEDMADKAADGFNRISTESGTSLEDFMENLAENKRIMSEWGDNMNKLWDQYSESGSEAVKDFLEFLGEAGPEQANLVAEIVEQGNLEEVAKAWAEAGQSGREAYVKEIGLLSEGAKAKAAEATAAIQEAANDAISKISGVGDEVKNIPNGEVKIYDNTVDVLKKIGSITDVLKNLPNGRATVTVDDDATWRIRSIMNTLSTITSVWHTVHITAQEHASGGIFADGVRLNAKGGTYDKLISEIPMHASGALNGIVARPTLTNIGWVGEDGAEAILHMGHAGGAVIPLTNQRYVRPFAQAVAANMGNRPSVTVNMNLNYDASDDAQQMLRDIERGLENYLNLEA